jgi:hypothetical protein
MQIHLSPIVGAFYRPPAKTIMNLLDVGHELVLSPEPTNQYDPNAIRVLVKLNTIMIPEVDKDRISDELMRFGASWEDLQKDEFGEKSEDPVFHLGYIPRSGGKTAKIDGEPSVGNLEVLEMLKEPNWRATLTYSPMGQTLVQIVIRPIEAKGDEEPDWTQVDPEPEQVKEWMQKHAGEYETNVGLAGAANEHFARPYHMNVLIKWAELIKAHSD